jgi:uncharacterized membrane protein (UPF0127 family)
MSDNTDNFNIRFIADTPEKREKGLMFTDPLDEEEVALFVFPSTGNYSFWNKNVSYPLSLAFLDENGKILRLANMEADSEKSVSAESENVRYVVEAQRGIFEKKGINKGDLVVYSSKNKLLVKKYKN